MSLKKKKILLMTATGSYNLGDELIFSEEYKFLHEHYGSSVEFRVFTYDKNSSLLKDESIRYLSYFPNNFASKPLHNLFYLIQNIIAIMRSDVIIVGGGGLIFDNEPGVSFKKLIFQWWARTKLARVAGSTIVYLGISLEIKNNNNKLELSKIFYPGDFIIVRDEASLELLKALEIPSSVISDLWFLYTPPALPPPATPSKMVGISVRGWFLGDSEQSIPQIYDFLIEKGYSPVFIVHTTSGDEEQNDSLYIKQIMKGRTYNVTKSIEQTLSVYPKLFAVIGMRFHSWVLACTHHIPAIMVSYGPKTDELIKLLDIGHMIMTIPEVNLDNFKRLWQNLEANYDREREKMVQKDSAIKNFLLKMLNTL